MELLQSLFLGIVQGITEFLPISSSGHLFLLPQIFGWDSVGLTFDVALHIGTLGAVIIFFWSKLWSIFFAFCRAILSPKKFKENNDATLGLYLLIGILPAGLAGFFFDDFIETALRTPILTASMLIAVGILFLGIETFASKKRELHTISLWHAVTIGVSQCLALIPGVSRSGITMLTALSLGYKHKDAAVFSFLLGTPIILAAGLFKAKDLFELPWTTDIALYFLVGIISSFIAGILCIKYFLSFLEKHSFAVFGWYRILFGGGVMLWIFL